jgi:hypothetical protein
MSEVAKRRWKFPEEPPRWLKWLAPVGFVILWIVKLVRELFRP